MLPSTPRTASADTLFRRRRVSARAVLLSVVLAVAGAVHATDDGPRWALPAGAEAARLDDALARVAAALLDEAARPGETPLSAAQSGQLQIVAGRHAQAAASVRALIADLLARGEPGRAQRWVPYLLLAEARAAADAPGQFEAAYAHAFAAHFAQLDDLAALQTHYWLVGDPQLARSRLQAAADGLGGQDTVSREAALDLARQQAFVLAYEAATRYAPALVRADEDRRFLVDDAVLIPAGDGVVLSAHLARSRRAASPTPAAMLFTIYTDPENNRNQALFAAAYGYAGIVVDARGKRLGTGDIAPYEHEGEDAAAAIGWIARQPWNDGRVAMYGGSYSGFAAWAAAKHRPPALKAIAPYVAAIPGLGLPMENNIFLNANYAWPFYVANGRLLDSETYGQRERWSALARTWYGSGRAYRDIDRIDGTPNPWLQRWLRHPTYDAYWQSMVPYGEEFADIAIPVLSITGYYDDGQISALEYYRQHLAHRPGADHTLLIGPYDHFGAQAPAKAMQLRGYDLDPSAQFDTRALTFQWLDHVLRGAPRPALLADRVNYQLMGADRWGHAPSLDAAAGGHRTLHLSTARDGAYRRLAERAPRRGGTVVQTVDLADRSTQRNGYYPVRIVHDAFDAGDAAVFVTAPFAEAVDVVGAFSGTLKVRTNKRDFDFTVVLHELLDDGRTMQLAYYVGRASHVRDMTARTLLEPGRWTTLPFERTRMTARRLRPGSRLLVTLDVLKDAQHQVNHGTGRDVSDETVADAGPPLRVEWHTDSTIRIPMRAAGPDPGRAAD